MSLSLLAKLISTKEAAKLTGYAPDYLSRLCRAGKISGQQVGGTWLLDRESLLEFTQVQTERKRDLADELSRIRSEEYWTSKTTRPHKPVVSPFRGRENSYSEWLDRVSALAITVLTLASASLATNAGVIDATAQFLVDSTHRFTSTLQETHVAAAAHFAIMRDTSADAYTLNLPVPLTTIEGVSTGLLDLSFFAVAETHAPEPLVRFTEIAIAAERPSAAPLSEIVKAAGDIASNPHESVDAMLQQTMTGYVKTGIGFTNATSQFLNVYEDSITTTGEVGFDAAVGMRDLVQQAPNWSQLILTSYIEGIEWWVIKTPEWAQDLTVGTYQIGNVVSYYAAEIIPTSRALYAAATEESGRLVYETGSSAARFIGTSRIQNAALGIAGKSALTLEELQLETGDSVPVASVISSSILGFSKQIGEAVYRSINHLLSTVGKVVGLVPITDETGVEAVLENASPEVSDPYEFPATAEGFYSQSTGTSTISNITYTGGTIINNTYVQNATEDELLSLLTGLKSDSLGKAVDSKYSYEIENIADPIWSGDSIDRAAIATTQINGIGLTLTGNANVRGALTVVGNTVVASVATANDINARFEFGGIHGAAKIQLTYAEIDSDVNKPSALAIFDSVTSRVRSSGGDQMEAAVGGGIEGLTEDQEVLSFTISSISSDFIWGSSTASVIGGRLAFGKSEPEPTLLDSSFVKKANKWSLPSVRTRINAGNAPTTTKSMWAGHHIRGLGWSKAASERTRDGPQDARIVSDKPILASTYTARSPTSFSGHTFLRN